MIFDRLFKLSVAIGAALGFYVLGGIAFSSLLGILGGSGLLPSAHQFLVFSPAVSIATGVFGFLWGYSR